MTDHNHGCGTLLPLPPNVVGHAVFGGENDCLRYLLERKRTDVPILRTAMFLWMNPSGADPLMDDRTVRRGWTYAESWGFQRMLVGNADAYRAKDQATLGLVPDPFGPENYVHLLAMAAQAHLIVAGYGQPKAAAVRGHGARAANMLLRAGFDLHALELAKDGTPKHPLYLRGDLKPFLWKSGRAGDRV